VYVVYTLACPPLFGQAISTSIRRKATVIAELGRQLEEARKEIISGR
jgi:hypothetical protein